MLGRLPASLVFPLLIFTNLLQAAVQIERVSMVEYAIPLKSAFATAKGSTSTGTGFILRLDAYDELGHEFTGYGEIRASVAVNYESLEDARLAFPAFRAVLQGLSFGAEDLDEDIVTLRAALDEIDVVAAGLKPTYRKPPAADRQYRGSRCGIDMALLDLVAKIHELRLSDVLGGAQREHVTISGRTFMLNLSAKQIAKKTRRLHRDYQVVRFKAGLDTQQDCAKLDAILTALQSSKRKHMDLWIDVNLAWHDAKNSLIQLWALRQVLRDHEFSGRFIVEQPVHCKEGSLEELALLTRVLRLWNESFSIHTMADESLWMLSDLERLVALDAADMVCLKPQKAGGLLHSMDMMRYLEERAPHIGVYLGGMLMTDLSAMAHLQLCCALPRLDYVTGCRPRMGIPRKIMRPALIYRQKTRKLDHPLAPGIGTSVNYRALEPYIVGSFGSDSSEDRN